MHPVYYAADVIRHDLRRLKKFRKTLLPVAIVSLVAMSIPVVAQQQVGGLRVLVTDQTGSVIPGAQVEFGSRVLIRPVFGVSDDQGLVINNSLPPGTYAVTVRFPGFRTAVNEDVAVQAGRIFFVEMDLEVGQIDRIPLTQVHPGQLVCGRRLCVLEALRPLFGPGKVRLFNQKTGLRTFRSLYRQSLPLWQPGDPVSQVLKGYDYRDIAASQGATRDPRFLQQNRFLDPIAARIGIRFVF